MGPFQSRNINMNLMCILKNLALPAILRTIPSIMVKPKNTESLTEGQWPNSDQIREVKQKTYWVGKFFVYLSIKCLLDSNGLPLIRGTRLEN